ncbi:(2Fe-2S)-binding protein [Thermodesulfovibrio hydrogeniphilus]
MRKVVCRCEDLTEQEILHAIELGYKDIESLKRYTGCMTGPCQGKGCINHVVRILSQKLGKSIDEIGITVPRPPVDPVPLYILSSGEEKE